ncbi:hypothetical protein AYO45_01970 [Gammaproteobacteria bacterium SCGC AG-212-F23]|nr:hypothetical protein AYO45_01970 [Gammaproteobacteria bacterium SCGC AG-212-F23]
MNQKTYPKTIVLKKSIIILVIIGAVLIVFLTLHNLYTSSHIQKSVKNESGTKVQSIASQSDISWYQNQTLIKPIGKQNLLKNTTKSKNIMKSFDDNTTNTDDENGQQFQQDLQKAMGAPINSNQLLDDKQAMSSHSEMTSSLMSNDAPASGIDQNMQQEKKSFLQKQVQMMDSDYLGSMLKDPISPYEVQAGTVIPGVLITGINSDLPGQIKGQVRSNVYDSVSGKFLLIPQGSTLIGLYDAQIAYGQERVLVVWKRILFPNGQSINLEGMPGVDMSGYSGFNDKVNNHYSKIFGSVILMSVLSAGAQLSQPQNNNSPFQAPTVGQTLAQSLGTNLANTGTMLTAKNMNIQPTLEIRQGYTFNISVTKDIVFPSPYKG